MTVYEARVAMRHISDQHAAGIEQMKAIEAELEVAWACLSTLIARRRRVRRVMQNVLFAPWVHIRAARLEDRIDARARAIKVKTNELSAKHRRIHVRCTQLFHEHTQLFLQARHFTA